jgi:hypothetical protein
MEAPPRDEENASSPNGKTSSEFCSELSEEIEWDSLYSLEKTGLEDGQRKTEIWHIFEGW